MMKFLPKIKIFPELFIKNRYFLFVFNENLDKNIKSTFNEICINYLNNSKFQIPEIFFESLKQDLSLEFKKLSETSQDFSSFIPTIYLMKINAKNKFFSQQLDELKLRIKYFYENLTKNDKNFNLLIKFLYIASKFEIFLKDKEFFNSIAIYIEKEILIKNEEINDSIIFNFSIIFTKVIDHNNDNEKISEVLNKLIKVIFSKEFNLFFRVSFYLGYYFSLKNKINLPEESTTIIEDIKNEDNINNLLNLIEIFKNKKFEKNEKMIKEIVKLIEKKKNDIISLKQIIKIFEVNISFYDEKFIQFIIHDKLVDENLIIDKNQFLANLRLLIFKLQRVRMLSPNLNKFFEKSLIEYFKKKEGFEIISSNVLNSIEIFFFFLRYSHHKISIECVLNFFKYIKINFIKFTPGAKIKALRSLIYFQKILIKREIKFHGEEFILAKTNYLEAIEIIQKLFFFEDFEKKEKIDCDLFFFYNLSIIEINKSYLTKFLSYTESYLSDPQSY